MGTQTVTPERTPDLAPEQKKRSPAALALGSSVTAGSMSGTQLLGLQRSAGNRVATSVVQRAWGKKKDQKDKTESTEPPPNTWVRAQPAGRTTTTPRIVAPTGWSGNEDTSTYDEKLTGVNLGTKKAPTEKSGFAKLLDTYVATAQLRSAQIRQAADQLGYDHLSLVDLRREYLALKNAPANADKAILKKRQELLTGYKLVVNEHLTGKKPSTFKAASSDFDVDFDKATADSADWAARGQKARIVAEEERVNTEMLWDQLKTGEVPEGIGEKEAAEAKLSLDRLEVVRAQMKVRVDHLAKIDRIQGAGGKILEAIQAGALSFLSSLATLGLVGVEKEMNPLFFKGAGWTWHKNMPTTTYLGRQSLLSGGTAKAGKGGESDAIPKDKPEEKAFRLVLAENLVGKVKAFKRMLGQRKGGANGLDWLSGLLWFIGDGIVQSLMGVLSRIAIWMTVVSLALGVLNVPAHGALSPIIALLSTLASIITYIRFALAGVKAVITLARTAVDGLNMAVNKDPRMRAALKGRLAKSGIGVVGDAMQLGGFAVVLGGESMKEIGGHFTNAFNVHQDIQTIGAIHHETLTAANDTAKGISAPSPSLGEQAQGWAGYAGGVGAILIGADVMPTVGELASEENDLNATGEVHYLGGSNQKSHGHQVVKNHGTAPTQPWQRARPRGAQPNWMQQGLAREEEMRGQRGEYLVKEAGAKVKTSQSAVQEPAAKVSEGAKTANKFSQMLDKVKAFFSGAKKKKSPELSPEQIAEQEEATNDEQQESKRFAVILEDTVGSLTDYGAA